MVDIVAGLSIRDAGGHVLGVTVFAQRLIHIFVLDTGPCIAVHFSGLPSRYTEETPEHGKGSQSALLDARHRQMGAIRERTQPQWR